MSSAFRSDSIVSNEFYLPEPKYISAIRDSCPDHLKKMQMSYDECRILSLLLKMIMAENVLELGTLIGCSTAWIAHSLSGNNPKVISIEKSLNNYNIAKENIASARLNNIVELVNCDAIEFLEKYRSKRLFDAIFIDARKVDYSKYLKLAKQYVRAGGLIIADNTLMLYDVPQEIATEIRKFNVLVENDSELVSVILPTTSGMTVIMKKQNN
jgi:caffeoyl-CoA O-methyltransferase